MGGGTEGVGPAVSARKRAGLAALVYLVATVVFTYPLVRSPRSEIEWGVGDPLLVAYVLGWGQHALTTDPAGVFDASFYHPSRNTLSLSEHLFSVSVPLLPLAAFGEPLLVYNASVFLSFFLSALLFRSFLRRVGLGEAAALVGGLLFGFLPWRYGQLGHAQLGYTWWIPLALLFLETWWRRRSWSSAVACGASAALVFLGSTYHGFYFALFAAAYLAVRLPALRRGAPPGSPRLWLAQAAAAALAAAVLLAPSGAAYLRMARTLPKVNPLEALERRGADLLDYVNPSPLSLVWGGLAKKGHPTSDIPWEMRAFPGALALAGLASLPALALRARRREGEGGLETGVLASLCAGGGLLFLVSLGPTIRVGGTALGVPGVYGLLHAYLPGFDSMRVPVRASFYVGLVGAAAAALLLDRALAALPPGRRRALLFSVALLAVLDVMPRPLPYRRPDDVLRLREAMALCPDAPSAGGTDLVLPICDDLNYAAPLASAPDFRKLVNGKSGYLLPENGRIFGRLSERPFGPGQVEELRALKVDRLFLDRNRLPSDAPAEILRSLGLAGVSVRMASTSDGVDVLVLSWPPG